MPQEGEKVTSRSLHWGNSELGGDAFLDRPGRGGGPDHPRVFQALRT